jgi:hypothetical protein
MVSLTLRTLLRRQLTTLRNEAVWAREGLTRGHQPPHGFDVQVASALDSIDRAGLVAGRRAARYSEQILGRASEAWDVGDIDRVIDQLDDALRELELSVATG